MLDFLRHLFDTSGFPARWYCGEWSSGHGWLHICSDLLIWSAYFAIPVILVTFALRRRDIPFRAVFWLFGAFILACGTTHLMDALIFTWPAYRLAGVIKLITAIVSWGTVAALIPIIPRALAMRGPEHLEKLMVERTAELTKANETLRAEVHERLRAEEEVKRLNRELQIKADELQTIFDIVPIGVAIAYDPECQRILHNPYMSELLNVPAWTNCSLSAPHHERPTNFTNFKDGVEVPTSELPIQKAATGVEVKDLEMDLVCQGRELRKMLYHARPLYDGQGKVRGSVGVCIDITARKKVEEALQQSEQRFARFMQYLPGLAWIKDLQGKYVYANDAAVRAFRVSRDKLYGLTDDAFLPPETARQFKANDVEALQSGTGVSLIETLEQESGIVRSLVNKFTIVGADNKPALIGGIAIDITDRMRAEEALKAADRRKNEFLATLAHELRNPLAPIRNALELMRRAGEDIALMDTARSMMERQLGQMVRLIDDLLDISRITMGRLQLRKGQLELSAVIRTAVETVRPLIESLSHTLTVTMPPNPIYLNADPTRLAQVFANLLNNAAKYTEKGGHVWLTAEEQEGRAIVSVRDTGIGISEENLGHIFEMFSQASPALERSQGGLGIGLALVRGLVELHGGAIEAHSGGSGLGSEFIVRLPIMNQPVAATLAPDEGSRSARSDSNIRILVVDDNIDAAESLRMMLRLSGHEVQTAYDGLEAIQAAAAFRPDLVLLDIGLPKMNGYQVARHIREQDWGKHIVLIALTGWGQEDDKKRSTDAGFNFHLTKPVEPVALEKLVSAQCQLLKSRS